MSGGTRKPPLGGPHDPVRTSGGQLVTETRCRCPARQAPRPNPKPIGGTNVNSTPEFQEQRYLDHLEMPELGGHGEIAKDERQEQAPAVANPRDGAPSLDFAVHIEDIGWFGVQVKGGPEHRIRGRRRWNHAITHPAAPAGPMTPARRPGRSPGETPRRKVWKDSRIRRRNRSGPTERTSVTARVLVRRTGHNPISQTPEDKQP